MTSGDLDRDYWESAYDEPRRDPQIDAAIHGRRLEMEAERRRARMRERVESVLWFIAAVVFVGIILMCFVIGGIG